MTYEPSDAEWDVIERAGEVLAAEPRRTWTASELGRKLNVATHQVRYALTYMDEHILAIGVGNGAWRRFRHREIGEMPDWWHRSGGFGGR